jgi:hypothetical protein
VRHLLLALLCGAATVGAESSARACGASGGGLAGVDACSLEEHEEETRPKFRVGAAGAYSWTALRFTGDKRVDEERGAALVAFDWRPTKRATLRLGVGPFLLGSLTYAGVRYDFDPGLVATAAVSLRAFDADGLRPFLIFDAELATTFTATHPSSTGGPSETYRAFDLRLGAAAGYPIADLVAPYILARAFGGPVYWTLANESVLGTDVHHFQIGAGLSVTPIRRLDLFVEGVPLGEQGLSLGGGFSF